jgi:hypothetical protein
MREQPCLADAASPKHDEQSARRGGRLQFFQLSDAINEIQFHNLIVVKNMMLVKHYVRKA